MALVDAHETGISQGEQQSWIGDIRPEELNFLALQVQSPAVPEDEQKNHFERIVTGTYRGLYNLAFRITHDVETARDAMQEAYASAWKFREKFEGRAKYSTWLHRITVNEAINLVAKRTQRRKHEISQESLVYDDDDVRETRWLTSDDIVHETFEATDRKRPIWKALSRLSPSERAAVVLRDI